MTSFSTRLLVKEKRVKENVVVCAGVKPLIWLQDLNTSYLTISISTSNEEASFVAFILIIPVSSKTFLAYTPHEIFVTWHNSGMKISTIKLFRNNLKNEKDNVRQDKDNKV